MSFVAGEEGRDLGKDVSLPLQLSERGGRAPSSANPNPAELVPDGACL